MAIEKTSRKSTGLDQRILSLVQNLTDEKKQLLLELLIEWQQKENRDDERVPCLIAVDYSTPKRVYRDFIQDLSKGGVFIETRESLQIGESVSLTFSLPNSQTHFKVAGKIVRTEKEGIGVRFNTKLSRYQEEIIKKSIDSK